MDLMQRSCFSLHISVRKQLHYVLTCMSCDFTTIPHNSVNKTMILSNSSNDVKVRNDFFNSDEPYSLNIILTQTLWTKSTMLFLNYYQHTALEECKVSIPLKMLVTCNLMAGWIELVFGTWITSTKWERELVYLVWQPEAGLIQWI